MGSFIAMETQNVELARCLPIRDARASAVDNVRRSTAGRAMAMGDEMQSGSADQDEGELQQQASARPSKRRLSGTCEDSQSPIKRPQLPQTDAQQHGVKDETVTQPVVRREASCALHHPTPIRPEQGPASFLENSADHPHPQGPLGLVPRACRSAPALGLSGDTYRTEHCRSDSYLCRPCILTTTSESNEVDNTNVNMNVDNTVDNTSQSNVGSHAAPATVQVWTTYIPVTLLLPFQTGPFDFYRIDLGADTHPRPRQQLAARWTFQWYLHSTFPLGVNLAVASISLGLDRVPTPRTLRKATYGCAKLRQLSQAGSGGPDVVAQYFRLNLFPDPSLVDAVGRADRCSTDVGPHIWYGYTHNFFTPTQAHFFNNEARALPSHTRVEYPFLLIEFAEAPALSANLDGPVARCFENSAPFAKMVARLNHLLSKWAMHRTQPVNQSVFMVAMSTTSARLYVAWYDGDNTIHLSILGYFNLEERDEYLRLHRYITKILVWGGRVRLHELYCALNELEFVSRWRQWVSAVVAAHVAAHAAATNPQPPAVMVAHG